MKTILVPTNFSEAANNATLFAFKLAKKNKARVILLHAYNLPFIDSQSMSLNPSVLYETVDLNEFEFFRGNTEKLRRLAESKNVEIGQIYHKLVLGELTVSINDCIAEEKVDFLVVGTDGGSDWFSKLFGSNADSIIVTTHVPTLIIPRDYEEEEMLSIGFTTRFREKDKEALHQTIEFAKKLGLKVICMYAQTDESTREKELLKVWEEEFESDHVDFIIYPSDDVLETIEYFIVHQEIDILTMVTYEKDFFTELFTRRFTQKVSHKISIPLLVMHA